MFPFLQFAMSRTALVVIPKTGQLQGQSLNTITYRNGEGLSDGDCRLFCFLCLCDVETGDAIFSAKDTSCLYFDLWCLDFLCSFDILLSSVTEKGLIMNHNINNHTNLMNYVGQSFRLQLFLPVRGRSQGLPNWHLNIQQEVFRRLRLHRVNAEIGVYGSRQIPLPCDYITKHSNRILIW